MTTYSVNNTEQEKKIYCGREYEYNLTTNTQYNYIYVGDMPIALYVQGDSNVMYTLHTNYIGSIEKITNTAGEIVDSMSYTPFGQRRLYSDWSKTDTAKHLIDRGFTGQQHLDEFALINFNGRMYDPVLAHFLSPDPYIQSPENPLNYNRYAYCLFSPLQYVDPTGFFVDEWEVNLNGHVKWVRESKTHVLYSVDANGDRTGEFVVLKNRDILDQLVESGKQNKYNLSFAIGSESDQTDMIKAFKFLADHTDVEWRLDRFRNEYGGSDYSIGTRHNTEDSPSSKDMGHSNSSVIAFIHSHPNTPLQEERTSMGKYYPRVDIPSLGGSFRGDTGLKFYSFPNTPYYMYSPLSGNIWAVGSHGVQSHVFIKQINNYKGFFFGTLNTR